MSIKRFKVEKLIRDHLPDIMRKEGILVYERAMEHDEYIAKLKDKLQEEAKEVKHTKNEHELTEELADMLEVIYAPSKASGISMEQLEKARIAKQKEKGGFDKKIYNPYVDIEEVNPAIEYYLKKAEHYPLVETKSDCIFCQFARCEREVKFLETFSHCYAIKDEYPVSNGMFSSSPKNIQRIGLALEKKCASI